MMRRKEEQVLLRAQADQRRAVKGALRQVKSLSYVCNSQARNLCRLVTLVQCREIHMAQSGIWRSPHNAPLTIRTERHPQRILTRDELFICFRERPPVQQTGEPQHDALVEGPVCIGTAKPSPQPDLLL